jgi:hypothetical protein
MSMRALAGDLRNWQRAACRQRPSAGKRFRSGLRVRALTSTHGDPRLRRSRCKAVGGVTPAGNQQCLDTGHSRHRVVRRRRVPPVGRRRTSAGMSLRCPPRRLPPLAASTRPGVSGAESDPSCLLLSPPKHPAWGAAGVGSRPRARGGVAGIGTPTPGSRRSPVPAGGRLGRRRQDRRRCATDSS